MFRPGYTPTTPVDNVNNFQQARALGALEEQQRRLVQSVAEQNIEYMHHAAQLRNLSQNAFFPQCNGIGSMVPMQPNMNFGTGCAAQQFISTQQAIAQSLHARKTAFPQLVLPQGIQTPGFPGPPMQLLLPSPQPQTPQTPQGAFGNLAGDLKTQLELPCDPYSPLPAENGCEITFTVEELQNYLKQTVQGGAGADEASNNDPLGLNTGASTDPLSLDAVLQMPKSHTVPMRDFQVSQGSSEAAEPKPSKEVAASSSRVPDSSKSAVKPELLLEDVQQYFSTGTAECEEENEGEEGQNETTKLKGAMSLEDVQTYFQDSAQSHNSTSSKGNEQDTSVKSESFKSVMSLDDVHGFFHQTREQQSCSSADQNTETPATQDVQQYFNGSSNQELAKSQETSNASAGKMKSAMSIEDMQTYFSAASSQVKQEVKQEPGQDGEAAKQPAGMKSSMSLEDMQEYFSDTTDNKPTTAGTPSTPISAADIGKVQLSLSEDDVLKYFADVGTESALAQSQALALSQAAAASNLKSVDMQVETEGTMKRRRGASEGDTHTHTTAIPSVDTLQQQQQLLLLRHLAATSASSVASPATSASSVATSDPSLAPMGKMLTSTPPLLPATSTPSLPLDLMQKYLRQATSEGNAGTSDAKSHIQQPSLESIQKMLGEQLCNQQLLLNPNATEFLQNLAVRQSQANHLGLGSQLAGMPQFLQPSMPTLQDSAARGSTSTSCSTPQTPTQLVSPMPPMSPNLSTQLGSSSTSTIQRSNNPLAPGLGMDYLSKSIITGGAEGAAAAAQLAAATGLSLEQLRQVSMEQMLLTNPQLAGQLAGAMGMGLLSDPSAMMTHRMQAGLQSPSLGQARLHGSALGMLSNGIATSQPPSNFLTNNSLAPTSTGSSLQPLGMLPIPAANQMLPPGHLQAFMRSAAPRCGGMPLPVPLGHGMMLPTGNPNQMPIAGDVKNRQSGSSQRVCLLCGTKETPKWRCGNTLCNACGLRCSKKGILIV